MVDSGGLVAAVPEPEPELPLYEMIRWVWEKYNQPDPWDWLNNPDADVALVVSPDQQQAVTEAVARHEPLGRVQVFASQAVPPDRMYAINEAALRDYLKQIRIDTSLQLRTHD